ncbi:MAG: hypothetical protein V7K53_24640 [Nostoc sp.]
MGYYLITFDKTGKVRDESEAKIQEILRILSSESITDVFIFSHGWLSDVSAAEQQYDKWIKKMAAQEADIQLMQQVRPGFRPLLIGLHWPSLPWGDEKLESAIISSDPETPDLIEKKFSERIADTPKAKEALRTIGEAVIKQNSDPFEFPPEAKNAYAQLNEEAPLGNEGEGAEPGSDREPPDPQRMYENVMKEPKKGDFNIAQFAKEALLAPLRATSFWSMKARACQIGESSGSQLLEKLQKQAPTARFHLMGHSFGCIVVSAMLASPKAHGTLIRPVNSLALVQGALSLWSYCKKIPVLPGESRPGYFHRLISGHTVNGPIITTYSEHDTAVGKWYPRAAGVARQIDYAPDLPKYGGIGSWGIRGDDLNSVNKDMRSLEAKEPKYKFELGRIYNLNSSKFICRKPELFRLGSFIVYDPGGAHNEIAEREVAHAVWSAALSSSRD